MKKSNNRGYAAVSVIGIVLLTVIILGLSSCKTVPMGHRGIVSTMGKPDPVPLEEGINFIVPFFQSVNEIDIRSTIVNDTTEAFTSDTQSVKVSWSVNFNMNPAKVVEYHTKNAGPAFDILIRNQVLERIKVHTVKYSADNVSKMRDVIKAETLKDISQIMRDNGDYVLLTELNITNIDLDPTIRSAIEAKMVQDQETQKARYRLEQQQVELQISNTKTDAEAYQITTRAKAESEAIRIKGEALRQNTGLVELTIAERWDGKSPGVVVTGGSGASPTSIMLPIDGNKTK